MEGLELQDVSGSTKRTTHPDLTTPSMDSDFESAHDFEAYPPGSKWSKYLNLIWRGPEIPRDPPIPPLRRFPYLESLPLRFQALVARGTRIACLFVYLSLWLLLWARLVLPYLTQPPSGDGRTEIYLLTCDGAYDFWRGKNAACGMFAKDCPASSLPSDVIIRCPALCDRGSWLYSSRAVGESIVKYRGYFIGGGAMEKSDAGVLSRPYRADSFPCGAAVHLGVVSPFFGGCARVSYESGSQKTFPSTSGFYGVSPSINFASFFPKSFVFKSIGEQISRCYDPRLPVLLLNLILGVPVVFLALSSVFFWVMSTVGFWTIVSATDPPVLVEPNDPETFYWLISVGLERFLPTCFVLYFLWLVSVKHTFSRDESYSELPQHDAEQMESLPFGLFGSPTSFLARLYLWYPSFWLGVLNNVTFDRLPVDRMTWHDIRTQPGALLVFLTLGPVVFCCIFLQAYHVWLLGRFKTLLPIYVGMLCVLVGLANIPGLSLRIHHYVVGLLLIPGCLTRGRPAYFFQGILLGLFLSGVARWGFASIAETDFSLLRGEPLGKILAPQDLTFGRHLLTWQKSQSSDDFTDVSLLVNDIEYYRGPDYGLLNMTLIIEESTDLRRFGTGMSSNDEPVPIYLRLARFSPTKKKLSDYTRAAILYLPTYDFKPPPPGIT